MEERSRQPVILHSYTALILAYYSAPFRAFRASRYDFLKTPCRLEYRYQSTSTWYPRCTILSISAKIYRIALKHSSKNQLGYYLMVSHLWIGISLSSSSMSTWYGASINGDPPVWHRPFNLIQVSSFKAFGNICRN